ncbi:LysM domain-containing protein [Plectosphaerella plurivora]|uniref:LysM domain-containing protein n=1 Tax=Plectosphaerella plurivora TaxID=936078 RepID=A0A9P9A7T3_9PEZI|nr:LysM domain-containing protein [Plectosphaerella plurivora]
MVPSTLITGLVAFASVTIAAPALAADKSSLKHRSENPLFPYDPNTIKTCSYWFDNDGTIPCANMPGEWGITMENFLKWNPSITSACGNFNLQQSYCVESPSAPPPQSTTTTSTAPATTTVPSNGIATPSPTQPGMVTNCNRFHFVKKDSSCSDVLTANSISLSQLFAWNPTVKSDCTGLWGEVNLIAGSTTTTPPPTATTPSNGVETPSPIQDGMVKNCAVFHYVGPNTSCQMILDYQKISLADFYKWNPAVKADCTGLQKLTHACVKLIPGTATTTPPPTTTTPSNGVTTPSPIQEGMVKNCKTFHYIGPNTTCQMVLDYQKITLANFFKWNPAVKADCSGLWKLTHACVAVL